MQHCDLPFVCPITKSPLVRSENFYISSEGRRYPFVEEIPVFLSQEMGFTSWRGEVSLKKAFDIANGKEVYKHPCNSDGVDTFVRKVLRLTCGNLYKDAGYRLTEYPVPVFPVADGAGRLLLDVGCNWGRWSFAAEANGFSTIGIDPWLDAILAASRIGRQRGSKCRFIVGDARFLPFAQNVFDDVFSYSVIQHFARSDMRLALQSIFKALKPNGIALIQMANKLGIRSGYQLLRRGFSEGTDFEVRYYSPSELDHIAREFFDDVNIRPECFFGLGLQTSDYAMLSFSGKTVIVASEAFKMISKIVPQVRLIADSLYVEARKAKNDLDC